MTKAGIWRRSNIRSYIKRCASQEKEEPMQDKVLKYILGHQGFDVENYYNPRNVADSSKLFEVLSRFGEHVELVRDEFIDEGVALAYRLFARRDDYLERADLSDIKSQIKWSKSSGLPLLVSKEKSFQYSIDRLSQVLEGVKAPNPCIAYMRTGFEKKTRLIWGYPLEMILLEAKYAIPLIEHFKYDFNAVIPYGWKKPDLGVKLKHQIGSRCMALDYSKFDSTISSGLIRIAFDILFTWFDYDVRERQVIENYFIHCPIVMPDGNLYKGKQRGVPSGSYFTQLIDSVVNVILIGALNARFRLGLKANKLLVLGDDSIFRVSKHVSLTKIADFLSNYGIILNTEKSKVDELHFLGADWSCGLPSEKIDVLVEKALNPERMRIYNGSDWDRTRMDAIAVIYNYASCYLDAHKMIPFGNGSLRYKSSAGSESPEVFQPKWMSGSDAFLDGFKAQRHDFVTVASRMLT